MRTIHGQSSVVFGTKAVEVAVTTLGGQMAPVKFYRDTGHPIEPYLVGAWQDEKVAKMPAPVLVAFRGDFFCLPFGGNAEAVNGETHPPHGEVVGSRWKVLGVKKAGEVTTMSMEIRPTIRKGRVVKELSLVEGDNVIYSKQTIEGFAGRVPLGHHAMLGMPEKEGSVRLATSGMRFGMTYPGIFSDPKSREYQALLPGAKWEGLGKVPVRWKEVEDADLSRQPGRYGYADLVQLINESWEKTGGPAWTAATYAEAGYVWFSLKDPAVLRSTIIWMENHGRHGHPWNGRNSCLGLEDVTGYFAEGLKGSMGDNALRKEGVETTVELSMEKPTVVNYIQGVVKIPEGFENVERLEFGVGKVTLVSTTGKRVTASVRHEFLKTGSL